MAASIKRICRVATTPANGRSAIRYNFPQPESGREFTDNRCHAGVLLIAGRSAGVYWIVPGVLLSFAAGVFGAWVLLVEIQR